MKTISIAVVLSLSLSSQVFAVDSNSCANYSSGKCVYNPNKAVAYALKYYSNRDNIRKTYDNGSTFPYYKAWQYNKDSGVYEWMDNNCTNFANQVILAGLVGTSSKSMIWNKKNFFVDNGGQIEWYFQNSNNNLVGEAWKGSHALYNYAKGNLPSWKGLHFTFITEDSLTKYMDVSKVRIGDIIFTNWDADKNSIIDHVMVVTDIDRWMPFYNEIQVTYQSNDKKNVRLGTLNEQFNEKATFHVYRPTNFSNNGL